MNCYFCQNELKEISDMTHTRANGTLWRWYESCDYCTTTYGVSKVFTTPDEDGSVLFAHIYIDLPPSFNWHVRLHLKEGFTNIDEPDEHRWDVFRVPGFPINPSNAKDKVKLYLVFS